MNLPELNNIDLENKFSDQKIQSDRELVELFKKTWIQMFPEWSFGIVSFMIEFRRCIIASDIEWLLIHWYNNYESDNQNETLWGFELISKLLGKIWINKTAESLLSEAEKLDR